MQYTIHLLLSIVCLIGLDTSLVFAQPITILSTEHVDIYSARWVPSNGPPANPSLPDPRWFIHAWDADNSVEYIPSSVLFFAKPEALVNRPPGSQWDFLGTGAGQPLWVLPQTQNVNLLYAGSSLERIDPNPFLTYSVTDPRINNGNPASAAWVHFRLRGLSGPGQFSMWQTNSFGAPIVWMASSNGIGPSDFVIVPVGGHIHFNWGFTAPGFYQVAIEATAFLPNGDPTRSGEYIFTFAVNGVPEPTTWALICFTMLGAAWTGYRRHSLKTTAQQPVPDQLAEQPVTVS